MPWQKNRPWIGYIILGATLLGGLAAFWESLDWYKRPIAGILVDPDLAVSSVMLPSWDGYRKGLRFPDRVVWAEGHNLSRPGNGDAWDQVVAHAAERGQRHIEVRVQTGQRLRSLKLKLSPLDSLTWWIYAGGLFLVGALYLGVSALALTVRPRGQLAQTFAKAAMLFALFVFTIFDYHTSRRVTPLFEIAFCMVPFAALALSLRLPTNTSWLERYPWVEHVMDGVGAVLAAMLVAFHATGHGTLALRSVVSLVFGIGLLASAITFVVRYVSSSGHDRIVMRTLFLAMVPGSAIVGIAALLVMVGVSEASAGFWVVPVFALIPLLSLAAFVRHDFWGSRALLSRFATRVVITLGCALTAAAVASGLTVALADMTMRNAVIASSLASVLAATLLGAALAVVDRSLFRSRVEYKPSVEQLSEELTAVMERGHVASAVEHTVRRWLPTEEISFVSLDSPPPDSYPMPRPPTISNPDGQISIPARFGGETLGVLHVGRKRGGALYTDDDFDLLRTIANQAALALAHAERYEELEERRKQHAEIWRIERTAIVETLAAEMAHEIRYPVNYFRSLFRRGIGEKLLKAEEVDIGCEEVERLERLVADLRRVVRPKLLCQWIELTRLVNRSQVLLRDRLGERQFEIDVSVALKIRCDADKVTQVLVNLMSNALDAAPDGRVGVTWRHVCGKGHLTVWDSGDGFDCEPATVFLPLYTTKETGTGLGLPITHRIVRAHRWRIDAKRVSNRTVFTIEIPSSDIGNVAAPSEEEDEP